MKGKRKLMDLPLIYAVPVSLNPSSATAAEYVNFAGIDPLH